MTGWFGLKFLLNCLVLLLMALIYYPCHWLELALHKLATKAYGIRWRVYRWAQGL